MKRIIRSKFSLFLAGALLGLITLALIGSVVYFQSFSKISNLTFSEVKSIIAEGLQSKNMFENQTVTFLILGLDKREDLFESTLLTDTIILASLDTKTNKLTMIPIPRDLWINDLKTKINALYFYGEKRNNTTGPELIKSELERITNARIDYTLIMNYNNLDELVDLVGGIDVNVVQSFTDDRFPNPYYLSDQNKPIYKTIQFDKGMQNMNGEKALEYVRSRHSEGEEGSDASRSARQVQVFNAIVHKLSDQSFLLDPEHVGLLYRFWDDQIETDLNDANLVSIALSVEPRVLEIQSISIPTDLSDNVEPILVNPPIAKYGLWVWEPEDQSWEELREFIQMSLRGSVI